MKRVLAEALIAFGAVDRAIIVVDLLAAAPEVGQARTFGVRQAPRAGVNGRDLRMISTRIDYLDIVKDDHAARAIIAMTLEGPIRVHQHWTRTGRRRRQGAHPRGDHLDR